MKSDMRMRCQIFHEMRANSIKRLSSKNRILVIKSPVEKVCSMTTGRLRLRPSWSRFRVTAKRHWTRNRHVTELTTSFINQSRYRKSAVTSHYRRRHFEIFTGSWNSLKYWLVTHALFALLHSFVYVYPIQHVQRVSWFVYKTKLNLFHSD